MRFLTSLLSATRRPVGAEPRPHDDSAIFAPAVRRQTPAQLAAPEPMVIEETAYREILRTIGTRTAELGGLLGGQRSDGIVRHFHFDPGASTTRTTYTPDHEALNRLRRTDWDPAGLEVLGFVHSHPASCRRPSSGDVEYAQRILDAMPALPRLLLPIVQTIPDTGRYGIYGYAVSRSGSGVVVQDLPVVTLPDPRRSLSAPDVFDRVGNVYDLRAMASTRLVVVGTGGSAGFVESMARSGIGELVLIDPDVVEAPNIATQQTYLDDVGDPKVDALAHRLLRINPGLRIVTVRASIEDLDDLAMTRLIHRPLPNSGLGCPPLTILCGFTDDFWAQARVNRLALHFGVPMIAAQVYREGRGAELSFSVPGVTPACGRCVLGSRYRAYLEGGFTNNVTSRGTPLAATDRLNATKSLIALAMIHGVHPAVDRNHPGTIRWAELLRRIAERNLVQIRIDPDIAISLGLQTFDRVLGGGDLERLVCDETVWLPQKPEHPVYGLPPCPDCGGTGDLRLAAGTFADTRERDAAHRVRTDQTHRTDAGTDLVSEGR